MVFGVMLQTANALSTGLAAQDPSRSVSEDFATAVIAVVLALMVAVWLHGIYCYVQMVRHRRPGIPASSLIWPAQFLSERGLHFRRRAIRSYAAFAVLALTLVLLNRLVPG